MDESKSMTSTAPKVMFEGNPMHRNTHRNTHRTTRDETEFTNMGQFLFNAIQFLPASTFFWFDEVQP